MSNSKDVVDNGYTATTADSPVIIGGLQAVWRALGGEFHQYTVRFSETLDDEGTQIYFLISITPVEYDSDEGRIFPSTAYAQLMFDKDDEQYMLIWGEDTQVDLNAENLYRYLYWNSFEIKQEHQLLDNSLLPAPKPVAPAPVATELVKVAEERAQLLKALDRMLRSYSTLLEGGRQRILDLGGDCDDVITMQQACPDWRAGKELLELLKGVGE